MVHDPEVALPMQHQKAVERIATDVKKFYANREPFRINHGSTNSTRHALPGCTNFVEISDLSRVLSVNSDSKSALVEPNVPMDRLVELTIPHGLIPPIVMEFPGITVGGGYAGTGGESSSFRYGYFNETVKRVEIVLGDGRVVYASPQENADLFYGASGSVGSLGITTLLELQLIPAKKYVRTTYYPVRSIPEAVQRICEEKENSGLQYLDGILFSQSQGVVVTGVMTDECPAAAHIQSFSDPSDPWYYLHVKEKASSLAYATTEYIPLSEYLFRYDRGGFWVGASAFEYFKMPFNQFTRWWLDDFVHTRMLYKALHASGQSRNYIVQDLALPFPKAVDFINYTTTSFDIWPLWLCPLRQTRLPTLHPHSSCGGVGGGNLDMLLNIGLWGFGPSNYGDFVVKNRELERKLREFGGMKWLYAQAYYSEDEFWEMFDQPWYDSLRKKYHAEFLPSIWHKVRVDPDAQRAALQASWSDRILRFWPLGGLWGLRKAIQSREYQLARNAGWKQNAKSSKSTNKVTEC